MTCIFAASPLLFPPPHPTDRSVPCAFSLISRTVEGMLGTRSWRLTGWRWSLRSKKKRTWARNTYTVYAVQVVGLGIKIWELLSAMRVVS